MIRREENFIFFIFFLACIFNYKTKLEFLGSFGLPSKPLLIIPFEPFFMFDLFKNNFSKTKMGDSKIKDKPVANIMESKTSPKKR